MNKTTAKGSVKYEIVLGLTTGKDVISSSVPMFSFMKHAKTFYKDNGIYVSAITTYGKALYNTDWGCPVDGEPCITFNCTANPKFISDLEKYEEGILYIAKQLKYEFDQSTVTVTKLPAEVFYLCD